jgi:hypothetical protein
MAIPRIGGAGVNLPLPNAIPNLYSNRITIQAGQTYLVPSGQWQISLGNYTNIQFYDPVSLIWRNYDATPNVDYTLLSDGANMRIVNTTGCAVGAVVTNVGSGYTSIPTATSSAGGSLWRVVLGPYVNTTQSAPIGAANTGSNYTYPPICVVDPPPPGGVQCTMTCTISAGAINALTVVDVGGGYTTTPTLHFIPDPRDPNLVAGVSTPLVNAANYTLATTGAQTVAAVLCTDPGNAVTALPTLSFSGGGGTNAAATVVMNWTVTGIANVTAGTGYGAGNVMGFAIGGLTAATPVAGTPNPSLGSNLTQIRQAILQVPTSAGGITATGLKIVDGGLGYQAVPQAGFLVGNGGLATNAAGANLTVGGTTDSYWMQPI